MKNAAHRVMAIGYDGGSWNLLRPWAEAGYLPCLKRFLDASAWGVLQSTIPPNTGPAWSSFVTGKNPGKHGVTDFRGPMNASFLRPILSSRAVRGEKIWQTLSRQARRVTVLNVPMTYPVDSLNGCMLSGMLTPHVTEDMVHPPELFARIRDRVGAYRFPIHWEFYERDDQIGAFVQDLEETTEMLQGINRMLVREEPWDLFVTVFDGMDRIQHLLWRLLDPAHPAFDPDGHRRHFPALLRYYQRVDRAFGELVDEAGRDTVVVLFSDHGFGPLVGKLHLNTWLEKSGYLRVRRPAVRKQLRRQAFRRRAMDTLRALDRWSLRKVIFDRFFRDRINPLDLWAHRMGETYDPRFIDWEATRAYSASPVECGIFLNRKGREPRGVVEPGEPADRLLAEIAAALREIRDPRDGDALITEVHRGADLYHGPFAAACPDLLFVAGGHAYTVRETYADPETLFSRPELESGYHRREGILAVRGPMVEAGATGVQAGLADLAPTFLYLLDAEIPGDMDGRVLTDLFRKEFVEARPPPRVGPCPEEAPRSREQDYTEEEEEALKRRLRQLGYLD